MSRSCFRLLTALSVSSLALLGCDDDVVTFDAALPDTGPPMPDAGPGASCDDGERNGEETSIDCGGPCDPCPSSENCRMPTDCESGVCDRGRCLVGSCRDGVQNGDETGVDCGGDCGLCPGGEPCTSNGQCLSGRCRGGSCTMSDCEDGVQNGEETDVDCGGSLCPACSGGFGCREGSDCESLICRMDTCTDAACNDGFQNQDETSVDCGGSTCPGCREGLACQIDADCLSEQCFEGGCVSCMDRIVNGEETDVDCGGACPACDDGERCVIDADCESLNCADTDGDGMGDTCESCMDGVQNQDETDVDCGGSLCPGCEARLMCLVDGDCANGTCAPATMTCVNCMDGLVNQDETDVDCGGTVCSPCAPGRACTGDSDCASNICDPGTSTCNAPGCGDGVLNGAETSVDCGGGACIGCADGLSCVVGRDCLNGVCSGGVCQAPTCSDGVANGLETDIDCGGASSCPRCPDGRRCPNGPSDCISPLCTSGRCGDVRGHIVLIGHDYFSTTPGIERVVGNAVQLTPETGNIEVLVYDEFADRTASGEVVNIENAIRSQLTAAGRTVSFSRLSSSANLTTALGPTVDVLVIAEQESGFGASFPSIAMSWESTLRTFVSSGGVIILSTFLDDGWQLLDRPMLVDIGGTGSSVSGTLSVDPAATANPIAAGLTTYGSSSGTVTYTGVMSGGAISVTPIVRSASGGVVVYDALF